MLRTTRAERAERDASLISYADIQAATDEQALMPALTTPPPIRHEATPAEAAAELKQTHPPSRTAKLTTDEVVVILTMVRSGKSYTDAAKAVGCSHAAAARTVRRYTSSIPLAKDRLKGAALGITKAAIHATKVAAQKGEADPALELLDRLDVAPKRVTAQPGNQVMVVFGLNDADLPALPVIDATPRS